MKVAILAASAALTLCISAALAASPGNERAPVAKPATVAKAYVAKTERGRLAQQVVRKWAGYVQEVYDTRPMDWSRAMGGTFAQADLANLRAAAKRQTYEAMMGTLLGQGVNDTQVINKLARSGGSKLEVKSLGSSANDLVYTMVTPCRIADTRVAGGALSANIQRHFTGNGANFTAQGGSATDCGIPAEPSALVINVTVVSPVNGPSSIRLYPYGASIPLSASVNYVKSQIVGNELIVKQTIGQPFDFSAVSGYGTHVVIDVAGYFMAPEATALSCTTISTSATATANASTRVDATCPAGYTLTGGGHWRGQAANPDLHISRDTTDQASFGSQGWFVRFENNGAIAESVQVDAVCCRVPGR